MKMVIQTPDFKPAEKLNTFVEDNVVKLEQLSDRIVEGQVCLKLDKSDKKENKICEIKLVMPGNDLFASKRSDTFEEAVLLSVKALKGQLERWKGTKSKRTSTSI